MLALLASKSTAEENMAQLIVRNLDEELVQALKRRAAAQHRSTEEEHRQILQAALRGPKRRSLAEVLAAMPNVGEDADFEREQDDARG
jgi:antitoxin FitA